MAERRDKQRKFEEKRVQKDVSEWNQLRCIKIYTWGYRHRKQPPSSDVERDWDASNLTFNDNHSWDLSTLTVMDKEFRTAMLQTPRFAAFAKSIVIAVEKGNLTSISIQCAQGRHRSVAIANHLKDTFWHEAVVQHVELGITC